MTATFRTFALLLNHVSALRTLERETPSLYRQVLAQHRRNRRNQP